MLGSVAAIDIGLARFAIVGHRIMPDKAGRRQIRMRGLVTQNIFDQEAIGGSRCRVFAHVQRDAVQSQTAQQNIERHLHLFVVQTIRR